MQERLKALRTSLDLSQEQFAKRLGFSTRGAVNNWEVGRGTPSAEMINLICERFNVSKEWLETGNGNMFNESCSSSDDQIADFIGDVLSNEMDIRYRLISVLSRLDPEDWKLLEKILRELKET